MVNSYWVSYQADISGDQLSLITSFSHSNTIGEGHIRIPQIWSFKLALPEGLPRLFDTSSTFGLLGSIDAQSQPFSECFERALGDVLTIITCEIVEFLPGDLERSRIVFIGPPFPKLVGRLLSLRLDPKWQILWYSGRGVLTLISPDLDLEVPARTILCGQMSSWEDEPLLEAAALTSMDDGVPAWLALSSPDRAEHWWEATMVEWGGIKLPVELAASLTQVSLHRKEAYTGVYGEKMRQPDDGIVPPDLALVAGARRRPPSQTPSWCVYWPHLQTGGSDAI